MVWGMETHLTEAPRSRPLAWNARRAHARDTGSRDRRGPATVLPFRRPDRTVRPPTPVDAAVACPCRTPVGSCASAWAADVQIERRIQRTAAARAATRALRPRSRADARALEAHVSALFVYSAVMVHMERLELPFWVDRLTARLRRKRDHAAVHEWLHRLAAAPARVRADMTAARAARLQRRAAWATRVGRRDSDRLGRRTPL